MSRLTRRFPILLVLAAFLAAQGSVWVHRSGHASDEAARADEHLCPHGTSDRHLCDVPAAPDHDPDCALCASATGRQAEPVVASCGLRGISYHAFTVAFFTLPRMAPGAIPPAPRGPPA